MRPEELFDLLKQKQAYYEALSDARGVFQAPLVAYTTTYKEGGKDLCYMGRHYVHFPRIERDAWALRQFVDVLVNQLSEFLEDGIVLAAVPQGGVALTFALGQRLLSQGVHVQHLYIEKADPTAKAISTKERSKFMLRRHHIPVGSRVILIEDVVNQGASATLATLLVREARAQVVAVGCGVSRNDMSSISSWGRSVPLRSALQISAPYYRQDEPFVAAAIQANEVEYHPREKWPRLIKAQERALAHVPRR